MLDFSSGWSVVFPLINLLILITLIGMFAYSFILFVKFAKKGIEALKYIKKNKE